MADPNLKNVTAGISENDRKSMLSSLRNMDAKDIEKKIDEVDFDAVKSLMRKLNLADAASKLESMSREEIANRISQNPQVIDKLKNILK